MSLCPHVVIFISLNLVLRLRLSGAVSLLPICFHELFRAALGPFEHVNFRFQCYTLKPGVSHLSVFVKCNI
jgi:hypothetical protein